MSNVTVVITACNRPALLQQTLDSFFQFNTYPIAKIIVVDDSGVPGANDALKELYQDKNIVWLANETNLGQAASIDKAYALVDTEYVFHCEEDWEFYRHGFIEDSMAVLAHNPYFMQVWIRADDDTNNHPLEEEKYSIGHLQYQLLILNHTCWHGFSFNPGLRRLADYERIGPLTNFVTPDQTNGPTVEARIGHAYKEAGYRAAILCGSGYVRHIGWGQHIYRNMHEQAQHAAFIIPYRNRAEHLAQFLPALHSYLAQHGRLNYTVWVIEQAGDKPFNRGALLNAGAVLAKDSAHYFVFHDVDMLPVTADYRYTHAPCHIATQCSQNGYGMPYADYFGGVTLFDKEVYFNINGYSNKFNGWGSEDDECLLRVQQAGLTVERRQCRFESLAHGHDFTYRRHNADRYEYAKKHPELFKTDGINSLVFEVQHEEVLDERTRLVVVGW